MRMKTCIAMAVGVLLSGVVHAQTFFLAFQEVENDGSTYTVDVLAAFSDPDSLGSSNLQFSYHAGGLGNPTLVSTSLDVEDYTVTVSEPRPGVASLNISKPFAGGGLAIPEFPSYANLGRIRFDIVSNSGFPTLEWQYNQSGTTLTQVYLTDEATRLTVSNPATDLVDLQGTTLPIVLLMLEGRYHDADSPCVTLHWVAATDTWDTRYRIERSTDAQHWEPLGVLSTTSADAIPTAYDYTDRQLPHTATILYYRLRMASAQELTYSEVIAIRTPRADVVVAPTLASERVSVRTGASPATEYYLTNSSGQVIDRQAIAMRSAFEVPVAHLLPGAYWLTIVMADASTFTTPILRK